MLEVVFPTLNRPAEAARLVASIGNDYLITPSFEEVPRPLTTIVNELVSSSEADIIVVLADHIEVLPGTLRSVERSMEDKFPDFDGMVGLHIMNLAPLAGVREYCFFGVGRKFVDRFPDRHIFCDDYHHFSADTELGEYATKAGKFYFDQHARIKTWHPNAGNAPKDDTWRASRSRLERDKAIRQERQRRGLLWGESFERVNNTNTESVKHGSGSPKSGT